MFASCSLSAIISSVSGVITRSTKYRLERGPCSGRRTLRARDNFAKKRNLFVKTFSLGIFPCSCMRRLLINIGGYKGAAIDIAKVLRDLDEAAAAAGWNRIQMTDTLPGYERVRPDARANVYIGTGIHGDEPAGPL